MPAMRTPVVVPGESGVACRCCAGNLTTGHRHHRSSAEVGLSMRSVIITAALTGPIAAKEDNPALPTTPAEIAESAKGAYEAGAAIVHLHLRDADGRPTADLDTARRTVEAVREACPEVIVQLSTGAGLDVPYEERMKLAEARPAMATLNPCTMTFGVGEFRNPPIQVRQLAARMQVSFVMGVRGGMPADPALLSHLVRELPEGTNWQVIGVGRANLSMTTIG